MGHLEAFDPRFPCLPDTGFPPCGLLRKILSLPTVALEAKGSKVIEIIATASGHSWRGTKRCHPLGDPGQSGSPVSFALAAQHPPDRRALGVFGRPLPPAGYWASLPSATAFTPARLPSSAVVLWSPVIPAETVPKDPGGDTKAAEVMRMAGQRASRVRVQPAELDSLLKSKPTPGQLALF